MKKNNKTLMRAFDAENFNEDMLLIEEYSKLIRNTLIKIKVHKEFYIEELKDCRHAVNCIIGYSNIMRKNDLKSARNYLRTGVANGSKIYLDNISEELKNILEDDKFWIENIDKTK
ncbi:hypothetical protein HYH38_08440 [Clostridium botulinum]|uniref:hypothetical protein n=1 Tax=Clostridium botulinum TaxID=1491 RepID=UPI001967F023|nr:hypothetical protein [Clostridium botulinum]MBN1058577.1 hypothetical protein [Clostridium botulinum]MBN1071537.1 hypothetical protein [Clostridium botulinum]MBY6816437.1 hypothetical protein [Clostridium botulinum]MBY6827308.1 hypothetical protein [Clostridium botulinum]MBY6859256.1 hypothetical protein [Clostridium botulinum]